MKIKPVIAYAVINKKKPAIKVLDVFGHNNVIITRDEKIIKVVISEYAKSTK